MMRFNVLFSNDCVRNPISLLSLFPIHLPIYVFFLVFNQWFVCRLRSVISKHHGFELSFIFIFLDLLFVQSAIFSVRKLAETDPDLGRKDWTLLLINIGDFLKLYGGFGRFK